VSACKGIDWSPPVGVDQQRRERLRLLRTPKLETTMEGRARRAAGRWPTDKRIVDEQSTVAASSTARVNSASTGSDAAAPPGRIFISSGVRPTRVALDCSFSTTACTSLTLAIRCERIVSCNDTFGAALPSPFQSASDHTGRPS
jgi:hypothetical protein